MSMLPAAAQKKKSVTVNPGEKVIDKIPKDDLYKYSEFTDGIVYFRNNTIFPAKLNYNTLFSEMQFIDPKGDTLSLTDVHTIQYIIIKSDTLYFNKVCLQLIPCPGEVKLSRHVYFSFNNRERMTGMGTSTSVSADTYTTISSPSFLRELVAQERITLVKNNELYIGDRFGNFKPCNKKNVLEMYAAKETEVQRFIKENKINFNSEEDMQKLVGHFAGN
jgi:hypothetical protein